MIGEQVWPARMYGTPALPEIQEGSLFARFAEDHPVGHLRVQILQASARDPWTADGFERSAEGANVKVRPILFDEAVKLLCGDASALRKLLAKVFRAVPYEAFFWECQWVSPATLRKRRFELVVLPAPYLESAGFDTLPLIAESLGQYQGQASVRFASLGGDSMLVAPTWAVNQQSPATCMHIAHFFRKGPEAQQMRLLQELGEAISQRLQTVGEEGRLWVTASGLGVWLHVREHGVVGTAEDSSDKQVFPIERILWD